ncbi:hypothetical protein DSECCO2_394640 [anaerobic digester metagenome]
MISRYMFKIMEHHGSVRGPYIQCRLLQLFEHGIKILTLEQIVKSMVDVVSSNMP